MPEVFNITKLDINTEKRMPFGDHVEELRYRLLRAFFLFLFLQFY